MMRSTANHPSGMTPHESATLPPVSSPSTGGSGPLWSRPAMRSIAHGIYRPGGLELTDRLCALAGVLPGWRVLDVGCGTGASVMHLRSRYGAAATGMDALFDQVCPDNAATPLPLAVGSAAHPPYRPGTFQMILCECVLSLLPDTRAALTTFSDLLAPGGVLALSDLYLRGTSCHSTDPAHDTGPAATARAQGSCLGWGADQNAIEAHLNATGFTLRHFEDHSRQLKELAARLLLAGESLCLPDGSRHSGCGCGTQTPGYFLLIADKRPQASLQRTQP